VLEYRDSLYASDLLLCAVAHLDFFTLLAESPRTMDELSQLLGVKTRPLDVMLSLFLARDLIRPEGPRYTLTNVSRDYLVKDTPYSLVAYYASQGTRPQCLEFLDVLRTGRPAGWSSAERGSTWLESMKDGKSASAFTAAIDSRGAYLAERLGEQLDCSSQTALLDLAGGSGIYSCALASRFPNLVATVLEMEPVDAAALRSIAARGMTDRVRVVKGDIFISIPDGFDTHLFANAWHDWDYESIRKLAGLSYGSLKPGGMIVIFDAHLNDEKDGPLNVAEYSCLIMHSTEGRCYSTMEVRDVLLGTGFAEVEVHDVVAGRSAVTARKL
jgi:SAM-dependent methyltransferase